MEIVNALNLTALPALRDNYIWGLHDTQNAVIVDPGEATPVLRWLAAESLCLAAILITHHHADHTAGIADLTRITGAPCHGPASEAIPGVDHPLSGGERIHLLSHDFEVLSVPGHTRGHLAYYGAGTVFCGDTLFAAGCGRLFEGTPEQMLASLHQIAALPAKTRICCAHEYTEGNLRFAIAVEGNTPSLQARQAATSWQRAQGQPTLPCPLQGELETNPFLRCNERAVRAAVSAQTGEPCDNELATFTALRGWKDEFRG